MLPTRLKIIGRAQLHLRRTLKSQKQTKNAIINSHMTKHDLLYGYAFFSLPLDLEGSEEDVFHQSDMQLISCQEAFMKTLFDFDSWEQPNQQISTADILVLNGEVQECT
ncbi:hypothetical protein O181_035725 [Austropuccinia psidii MF-1]|uniref:Uncharacterized protein n=1 Tax=Austropuccinia psidii MF-1 TaxID=1389203 RepID=A0A9Q3D7F5_9BASI|nr:hypothetical protein [Austropuccinia psidii MF-1]